MFCFVVPLFTSLFCPSFTLGKLPKFDIFSVLIHYFSNQFQ